MRDDSWLDVSAGVMNELLQEGSLEVNETELFIALLR
jgi:hypothetical protein